MIKKQELNIVNIAEPKTPAKLTKSEKADLENLKAYKAFLLSLKILDPACGSGAFLNQALEFLIKEHKWLSSQFVKFQDLFANEYTSEQILEQNLYGVDINADAVEIAKLSLWLRTAVKGRTLINLNKNIITANSLLDFPFDFKFDVIIGNPPYIRVQGLKANYENESELYEKNFKSATGKYDIYVLFMELSMRILSQNGKTGFILPHKFLISEFGVGIREILSENRAVQRLVHFGSHAVFADASTYTCVVILSQNNDKLNFAFAAPEKLDELEFLDVSYENLSREKWSLTDPKSLKILAKIANQPLKVKDVFEGVYQGIVSGDNKAFYLYDCRQVGDLICGKHEILGDIKIEQKLAKKILNGKTIQRYYLNDKKECIIYPYELINGKTQLIDEQTMQTKFPLTYNVLSQIRNRLLARGSANMSYPNWYSLWNFRNIKNLEAKKILTPDVCYGSSMCFDENGDFYHNDTSYALILKENYKQSYKFYLSILNSSLMWFFVKNTASELRGEYFRFKTKFIEPFGLPKLENLADQEPFIKIADELISLNKSLQRQIDDFTRELGLEKLPTKLAKFYELGFDEFIKELSKAKGLKFKDKLDERTFKNEWRVIFENDVAEISRLKTSITKSENELDNMVFLLYGLNDDEIAVVKG